MTLKILGVSGSPIENSNTDRAVKTVLEASGLETEFVKLSEINVRPCRACKGCVEDNICKNNDDFPALAQKVREAKALVIGAWCPYSMIDAHTKAFLERLWSMRHVNNLNEGKLIVIVVTGVSTPGSNERERLINKNSAIERVSNDIAFRMRFEGMKIIGTIKIRGNVPCLTCGEGNTCKMSGVPILFGESAKASSDLCTSVEDQDGVLEKANRLGRKLSKRLS